MSIKIESIDEVAHQRSYVLQVTFDNGSHAKVRADSWTEAVIGRGEPEQKTYIASVIPMERNGLVRKHLQEIQLAIEEREYKAGGMLNDLVDLVEVLQGYLKVDCETFGHPRHVVATDLWNRASQLLDRIRPKKEGA